MTLTLPQAEDIFKFHHYSLLYTLRKIRHLRSSKE
ncbi:hypothetical protein SF123566_4390, partial [Shigella flexneri 1235-66]